MGPEACYEGWLVTDFSHFLFSIFLVFLDKIARRGGAPQALHGDLGRIQSVLSRRCDGDGGFQSFQVPRKFRSQ